MDPIERRVREDHPDWTDEQVAAEVARLRAEQEQDRGRGDDRGGESRDRAFADMRRRAERAERDAEALRRAAEERERREAEESGRWRELYEREQQVTAGLRTELDDVRTGIRVEGVARDLGFRRADEALAFLPTDVDRSDGDAVRAALEQLARDRPHLVDAGNGNGAGGATGGPGGGSRPQSMTTDEAARLARENPAEFNKRFEAGEIPASALGG